MKRELLMSVFIIFSLLAASGAMLGAAPIGESNSEVLISDTSTIARDVRTVESYVVESAHPYTNNFDYTWIISKSDATQIRVHFTQIEVENNYDYLYVYDYAGTQLHKLTGTYSSGGWSSWSYGESIRVRLDTDYSVTDWGFAIDQIEYEGGGGGGGGDNVLEDGVTSTSSLSATGATEMWTIEIGADAESMYSVLTCGSADFDLYGRRGAEPTTSTYDWRGYTSGGEEVTFNTPGAGTWYIMVRSYSGTGSYALTVTITYGGGGGGGDNVLEDGVPSTGSLSATGATEMWTIEIGADAESMYSVLTCGSADFDLYGRRGAEPTTSTYDWRGYTSGGEEVTFSSPGEGTWYIMVRSYRGTGSYELTVSITYGGGGGGDGDGIVRKWAVIVGISDYKAISDLSYCDEDATDWYNYLNNVMDYDYIRVLGDTHTSNYPSYYAVANEANVKASLTWLGGADGDDQVAFITSGHGDGTGTGSSYLCMWDCASGESGQDGNLYDTELDNYVGAWSAGQIFIFIDHCYSGGMIPEIAALSNSADVYIATTCTDDGYGYDDPSHNNGAWTYYFLEYGLVNHYGSNPNTLMESCFDYALAAYPHGGGDTPQEYDGNTGVGFKL
ncbi:MAG: pre-peptidase C-terminal domain-containing protein [Candidatus Thorarchaeota archaeon]